MDLCQKSETDLENNENQNTEETEPTSTCSDERSERNHVCCLLNISDITLEQDKKANECVIGTGWEEAVQGWGSTSPTACIWPRKKVKKVRVGESAGSCLLCVSISQGSPEARPQTEPGKLEARALAEAGPGKDQSSPSQSQGHPHGPNTASRDISKTCFPHYSQGEKKSLQLKEFVWCTDDWTASETVKSKDPKSHERPGGNIDKGFSISDSLASKALLVLPPLKASSPDGLDALGKKSKNVFLQQEEKGLSVEKVEGVAYTCELKTVDGQGERRPVELAKHLKVKDSPPFPPQAARPTLLANPQPCCLHWSLLPERSLLCPPTPSNMRYLATLRLLQKQGMQNYKAKFKPKEPRPSMNTQKHILTEAKQENRPQTLETKVFPRPLLPSLTVSRVVIPGLHS
ncbi:uncharacterized protein C16orf46 homolog [Trichechus manatus latirostris]|uniref:Uncharacterized protein C16orf46 homolog n=1 Tax=Trichechus manatus latirostris TaxID=127582 RepID=A0A2Y9FXF4_TRIMA|nr:uncharacterized protein C16orf46 homolog [Trichechus manatus latirostris]